MIAIWIALALAVQQISARQALCQWIDPANDPSDEVQSSYLLEHLSPGLFDEGPSASHLRLHGSIGRDRGDLELTQIIRRRAAGQEETLHQAHASSELQHLEVQADITLVEPADERLVKRTRAAIEAWTSSMEFSGAVLVEHNGTILMREAWGLANREEGRANTVETRFNIGSITKLFTGIAVARFVEQGRLGWDDPVLKHLPDPPPLEAIDGRVCVAHLLTHSSGLGDYWGAWKRARRSRVRDVASYLALTRRQALEFEPGSSVRYSNVGVVLLGRLLEVLSGRDYYEHIEESLFAQLGMQSSDFGCIDPGDATRAVGYERTHSGKLRDASRKNPLRGSPAGGSFSTVDDLLRFARALRDGKVVRLETLDLLSASKVELAPGVGYGYLCFALESRGVRRFGHDGGSEGVNAELWIYPDEGYVVIVLANIDNGADRVAGFVNDEIVTRFAER